MNYLSGAETQASVPVLWAILRWLAYAGPTSYTDLSRALRPPNLVPGDDNALRAALSVGHHIGLAVTSDGDTWQVADDPAPSLRDHDSFRRTVRHALLARAVSDLDRGDEPADVAVGIAWLLRLDPVRPLPWAWADGSEAAVRAAGLGEVVKNETQWRAFRRWALSLGFTTRAEPSAGKAVLVPDPTTALADLLGGMTGESTAVEFRRRLGEALPVADGGVLDTYLSSRGVRADARSEAMLGPATAYALLRLQHRGTVRLLSTADAAGRVTYRVRGTTKSFDRITIDQGGRHG